MAGELQRLKDGAKACGRRCADGVGRAVAPLVAAWRTPERMAARAERRETRQVRRMVRADERERRREGLFVRYPFARQLYEDSGLRTVTLAYPTFGIDVLFAVVYGVMGILLSSPWHGTLAALYLALSAMRFFVLRTDRGMRRGAGAVDDEQLVWRRYRLVGVLLVCFVVALAGAIVLLVNDVGGASYPGYFIYAVAAYTFYIVIFTTVQFFRKRRVESPLLQIIRRINLANSLLALLSLQTALISTFGDSGDTFSLVMSIITGTVVCVLVALLGVSMIIRANRELRQA